MPLLGLFSRKSKASSKASTSPTQAAYSTSNLSLDDDGYVSVSSPRPSFYQATPSSTKLALPFRRKGDQPSQNQQQPAQYSDPLLEPPPRRSSLFQTYQDDHTAYRSTQSLPDGAERRPVRPQAQPQQHPEHVSSPSTKKSMFSWATHKERSKSVPSAKPDRADDTSFNLKSFRHVRPNSPSFNSTVPPSPSSAPAPVPPMPTPTPTSSMPSPLISFQVTSRRPRGTSVSELSTSTSTPTQQNSQLKMAAGAFRQAARRSATSLTLTDSPVISPVRSSLDDRSLDDRPPPSLLLQSQGRPGTPPRPPRPQPPRSSSPYPPKPTTHTPASKRAVSPSPAPRKRTNAFSTSSSSSSSSEEEADSDSGSDTGGGTSHLSRNRTIRPNQPRVNTLPPLSASVREQIQRSTPPTALSALSSSVSASGHGDTRTAADDVARAVSAGARPRASLSAGALSPSAKEARASVAMAANARLMSNAPLKPASRPRARNAGSDTSESASSTSDEDEDAPLSSLVPPRRPGTSVSSHSAPTTPRKPAQPLVNLDAPSTLTGRLIRAPPPLARDDDARQKPRISVDVSTCSRVSQAPQSSRVSQASSPQGSRISQAPSAARTLVSLDTPTTPSFSGSSSRLSGARQSSASLSPAPPQRPFARRESPASSTGDSSSGKAPLTPRDGSDYARSAYSGPSAPVARGRQHGHGRRQSVTFEDEREGGKGKSQERGNVSPQEARRRERRRSEARAAIELGNVVNGPPPVDLDDVALGQHLGMQAGWPQPGMQMPMHLPMPPVPPMFNMHLPMGSPGGYGFPSAPPSPDPAFLAAHQQAMAIAKQTFQYAVAQQAMAAANDEWERGSAVTSLAPQWGYGMGGVRNSAMFAPGARSMYAGSVGGGGGAWGGTGSVYGDAFGPATAGVRQSMHAQADLSGGGQRPPRQRTKTAPSSASPPAGSPGGRIAPPSSFRAPGQ